MTRKRIALYVAAIGVAPSALAIVCSICAFMALRSDLEFDINLSLPPGSSRQDVEQWLTARSMPIRWSKDTDGKLSLRSFVPDTGNWGERWTTSWVRDTEIRFYFDDDERLISHTTTQTDRF